MENLSLPARWNIIFMEWFWISLVIWLIVTIPMVYFLIKYKRKNKNDEGADIEGHHLLEIVWLVIPTLIVIYLGLHSYSVFKDFRLSEPQNAYEVKAEAFQFGFRFIYPNGVETINELHVPVGGVKILLTSRDVIHNFAVPQMRVKEDMVPGRTSYLWFISEKPEELNVFCSELCGPGHSLMRAKIYTHAAPEFDTWLVNKKQEALIASASPVKYGEKLFSSLTCITCHSKDGSRLVGPSLKGVIGRKITLTSGQSIESNEAYVRESIQNPTAKVQQGYPPAMPNLNVPPDQIEALIAYLKTLQ
jgi:cytochrome c oxidase subunit 2